MDKICTLFPKSLKPSNQENEHVLGTSKISLNSISAQSDEYSTSAC